MCRFILTRKRHFFFFFKHIRESPSNSILRLVCYEIQNIREAWTSHKHSRQTEFVKNKTRNRQIYSFYVIIRVISTKNKVERKNFSFIHLSLLRIQIMCAKAFNTRFSLSFFYFTTFYSRFSIFTLLERKFNNQNTISNLYSCISLISIFFFYLKA